MVRPVVVLLSTGNKIVFIHRVNWETEVGQLSRNTQGVQSNFSRPAPNPVNIRQERIKYVYIYTGLMLVVLYLVFQRALAFFCMCLKASRRIHDKLYHGVIRAKMYFFSTNSSGRIINRFSKDIFDIDSILPIAMYDSVLVRGSEAIKCAHGS